MIISINMEGSEDMKAMALCNMLEDVIGHTFDKLKIEDKFYLTFKISPEIKLVEVDFSEFEMVSEEEMHKKDSITIIKSEMKKENTIEENIVSTIHYAIEVFVENWLKFRIKELKIHYYDEKCYVEIPRGFADGQKYIDNLDGWDKKSFLWHNNYDVTDELHKIGGLKDDV